jgi:hypothetical protein
MLGISLDVGVQADNGALRREQTSDDLSGEYALFKYRHIDAVAGDPATTLAQIIEACDEASTEDLVGAENSSGPLTCGFARTVAAVRWISGRCAIRRDHAAAHAPSTSRDPGG